MKRSKAVDEIYDILCDYYEGCTDKILTEERDELMGSREFAEHILYRLESIGMLPPKSLDTVCLKQRLVRGYSMFFEWEEEDEG